MGGYYNIAGKQVPFHKLSIFFISGYAALGVWAANRPSAPKPTTPVAQTSSSDEDALIKEFLQSIEAEEKK